MDCSLPASSLHEILQTRTLEWVSCPPPGDLPDPCIEPVSPVAPALQADSLTTEPLGKPHNKDSGVAGSDGRLPVYNAGDPGSIPGLG